MAQQTDTSIGNKKGKEVGSKRWAETASWVDRKIGKRCY